MSAPRVVHQFWYCGKRARECSLPPMPRLSQRSFAERSGCTVWFWCYGKVSGHAPAAVVKDASELLPEGEFRRHLAKGVHIAHMADWLRWIILYKYGGWWADLDAVCLRRLPTRPSRVFQTIPLKRTGGFAYKKRFYERAELGRPNNSVLRVPPGDPLMAHMVEYTAALIRKLNGPLSFFDKIIFEFGEEQVRLGYERYVLPPIALAPIYNGTMPDEKSKAWFGNTLPGFEDIRRKSYVIDFWGERSKKTEFFDEVMRRLAMGLP